MRHLLAVVFFLAFLTVQAQVPLTSMIDRSEEFLTENVTSYAVMRTQALEHEQFDVLIFEDKDMDIACYFTFYRGEKLCNMARSRGTSAALKKDVDLVKSTFSSIGNDQWENTDKTVLVRIDERDGMVTMIAKGTK